MRIALVNQWYPPDYGGVGVYNGAMARAYAALGHQVTVITARSMAGQPPVQDEPGIRVHRVDRWVEPYSARRLPLLGPHVRSLRHLLYSYKVGRLLEHLACSEDIDVAEFAEINAEGLVGALTGTRLPAVVRCHTPHVLLRQTTPPGERRFDTTLIERAEAAVVRRATALTAPSTDLARRVEQEMRLRGGRIAVIPNAIDVDEFSPGQDDAPAGRQPLTILYVGRLEREKGIFVLAEALARLSSGERLATSASGPAWRVVFAGGDRTDASGNSNREHLQRFFAAYGLGDRVELRGFVAQDELVELYRSADLCVVPSTLYESFSYTCLQAMACGRPLVATTMGGIPEVVVDGETGLLVPPGDTEALAAALGTLLGDAELRRRLGTAGRERAVRLYSHLAVAGQNLAMYEAVIQRSCLPAGRAMCAAGSAHDFQRRDVCGGRLP